jgi:pimeloyl-ACP methyl ester carboxylesterase
MQTNNVVLIPGLWMNRWFMTYLGRALRRCGFQVFYFDYSARHCTLQQNSAQLQRWFEQHAGERMHVVAHSLGGRIVLNYLNNCASAPVENIVLLGTPLRGRRVVHHIRDNAVFRFMLGQAAGALQDDLDFRATRHNIGMLAGNVGVGLGCLVAPLPGPRDGAVAVEETRAEYLDDHKILPVSHSGMLFSRRVAEACCQFLAKGHF